MTIAFHRHPAWAALLALCSFIVAPAAPADDGPLGPVTRLQETLIGMMKDGPTIGFPGRRDRADAVVDQVFDVPQVTRAVLGRHYAGLTPAERGALGRRVRAYAVATLASRFTRYDGERFDGTRVSRTDGGQARAKSRFLGAGGRATSLDYLLLRDGPRWRIVNVWFDGVSGTDIQRAEFEVFLRDGGASRLITRLDELIERLGKE